MLSYFFLDPHYLFPNYRMLVNRLITQSARHPIHACYTIPTLVCLHSKHNGIPFGDNNTNNVWHFVPLITNV